MNEKRYFKLKFEKREEQCSDKMIKCFGEYQSGGNRKLRKCQ